MNFLHYALELDPSEGVEVTLDKRANIKLLDETNFDRYRRGRQHKFYGGLATRSPVKLAPPHAGTWHVVIDLGGYPGSVRASVRTVRGPTCRAAIPTTCFRPSDGHDSSV